MDGSKRRANVRVKYSGESVSKPNLPTPEIVVDHDTASDVEYSDDNDGLEPAWSSSVHKDSGELFYLEAGKPVTSPLEHVNPATPKDTTPGKTNRKGIAQLQKVLKVSRSRDSTPQSSPNGSRFFTRTPPGSNHKLRRPSPGSQSSEGTPIKEVILKIGTSLPRSPNDTLSIRLQGWLGIVPGKGGTDSSSVMGNGREHKNGGPMHMDDRLMVRGLLPQGAAIKSAQIDIGDVISAINGVPVSYSSAEAVLNSMEPVKQVRLSVERAPSWSNGQSPSPMVCQPPNGTLVKMLNNIAETASKQQEESKGNPQEGNPQDDVPCAIMYLTLVRDSDNDDAQEVLYKYPSSKASTKFKDINGLFITLGDMLMNITGSKITCTSLEVGDELVHVGYHKCGSELLVLALPARCASKHTVQCMVQQLARLLNFMFLSLNRAFSETRNHSRLDHLLALLFHQALVDRIQLEPRKNRKEDIFIQMLPGVRWLNLPDQDKLNVDCSLSELEAADFADLCDRHFDYRRPYVILGSCLFYKGYLLANHLPVDDLLDIHLYVQYYSLSSLSTQRSVGQLVIWREVFPTRRVQPIEAPHLGYTEPQGRWFLLIVGLKHSVLCAMLEAGGCASPAEGVVYPDEFYVDQSRATLLHLETLDVPSACEERLKVPPIPALSCADWLFPSPRRGSFDSSVPPRPHPDSPMLSKLHSQTPIKGPGGKKAESPHLVTKRSSSPTPPISFLSVSPNPSRKHASTSSRTESDNESDSTSPHNSRTNSTQSSPSTSRRSESRKESDASIGSAGSSEIYRAVRRGRIIPDPYSMGVMQKALEETASPDYFTATKLTSGRDNSLFHYVHLDPSTGILITPTRSDLAFLGGLSHSQLVDNFQQCCKVISQQLTLHARLRPKDQLSGKTITRCDALTILREFGISFRCHPENWPEKKQPPSIKYWVVGRLIKGPRGTKECYVCYHDSTTQNTLELAFKLVFGVGP
ncbi:protein inturned-like [Lytechinus pictus]|uniref:protein inturned-like n=1 Tax=Lytechinus pictus TaxID=7653 RepID=UPI0030B9E6E6